MTASSFEGLLDVQDHDVAADQLRHRRETLPERLALAEVDAALARIDLELAEIRGRLDELGRTQRRLEDEVSSLDEKIAGTNLKLYSGSVVSPRELQGLQGEVEALGRRKRSLEDDLLDVMEASEPVAGAAADLEAVREERAGEAARLRAAIAEAERAIDEELDGVAAARRAAASSLPPDLMETYEDLRKRLGGTGAARLESGRCTGCHLALPAMELEAVRRAPADALVRHEECGRILVRTG